MNQSGQLAQTTGLVGIVGALAVVIQWFMNSQGWAINPEQAGALSTMLYPVVHLFYLRLSKHMDAAERESLK